MAQKSKKKTTLTHRTASIKLDPKQFSVADLVKELNSFNVDNYWDLGRFLVEKVMPVARKQGMFEDQVLKMVSSHPGIKFPFSMLKQCQQYYSYYPDVKKRSLPEVFYFDLATKVDESRRRDHYEKMAVDYHWSISDLRKKIHDDDVARRIDERTKYGFDLRERNVWTFETPDPRFGKPNFKGRIPGQIVANALYYFTKPGDYVLDPFGGSGTLGDVIDSVPHFQDRKYKMYDVSPIDDRIVRNNILQMGLPEQTGTVDYVFLDPPAEYMQKDSTSDFGLSLEAIKADFVLKFKGIVRECARVLKSGGKVSIVVEPAFSVNDFIDFPHETIQLFRELGFKQIGKAYLPRRSGESMNRSSQGISEMRGIRILSSDCRELLTFQKG
ncbi:MAG TPA: DNA methyltransferase [Bacteroidota bacterium]|jgi:DNA modification methylase|nr:DNA methyltransferase [Bacteroidota bacterium]